MSNWVIKDEVLELTHDLGDYGIEMFVEYLPEHDMINVKLTRMASHDPGDHDDTEISTNICGRNLHVLRDFLNEKYPEWLTCELCENRFSRLTTYTGPREKYCCVECEVTGTKLGLSAKKEDEP